MPDTSCELTATGSEIVTGQPAGGLQEVRMCEYALGTRICCALVDVEKGRPRIVNDTVCLKVAETIETGFLDASLPISLHDTAEQLDN